MSSSNNEDINSRPIKRKKRCCRICGLPGHDRRICPSKTDRDQQSTRNSNTLTTPPPQVLEQGTDQAVFVDGHDYALDECVYVVIDLETTGFSRTLDHIIEIALEVLTYEGIAVEDGNYSSLVRPPRPVPNVVSQLTGISDDMVKDQRPFSTVIQEVFKFIDDRINFIEESGRREVLHAIFVGHNARRFDFPFLVSEMKENNLLSLLQHRRYRMGLDTMILAKISVQTLNLSIPSSYKLCDLYEYIAGASLENAHRASADVKATSALLRYKPFWGQRKMHFVPFVTEEEPDSNEAKRDDSDIDSDSSVDDPHVNESEEDSSEVPHIAWKQNKTFKGFDCAGKFAEEFQRRRTRLSSGGCHGDRTGLQCAESSVNSPNKAWRQIFTNSILDKIVSYTNLYGEERCKDWVVVTRQDITDFVSILFISKWATCNQQCFR